MTKRQVTGWLLDEADRAPLLERFPPKFENVVAHHVTLQVGGDCGLPRERAGEVVGATDGGAGVQALVVSIGGTTDRPDGSTYHITWSLGPGRKAKESNDVILEKGWWPIDKPVPIGLEPARL